MNFGEKGFDKKILSEYFSLYEIKELNKTKFENIITNDFSLRYFSPKKELTPLSKKKVRKDDVKAALNFLINVGVIHKTGLVEYIDMISGKKTGVSVVEELIKGGYVQKAKIETFFKKASKSDMIIIIPSNLFLEKMRLTIKGINHMFLKHTLISNYIVLQAIKEASSIGFKVSDFGTENTLKNDEFTQHLFADGFVELTDKSNPIDKVSFFYEIDNGTETISTLLSKCIRYKRLFEDYPVIRYKKRKFNTWVPREKMRNAIMFSFTNLKRIKEFNKAIKEKPFITTNFNGYIFAGLHQHYFKRPFYNKMRIL